MIQENLQSRLCLMLAFQAVAIHDKSPDSQNSADKVVEYARQINKFCNLYLSKAFPVSTINFVEDVGAEKVDAEIQKYLDELRGKETTQLPQNKEVLIKLYDRLQQRKSRRMQLHFYATVKEEKIADLVLKLLDEEIEDANAETPQ